MTIPASAKIIRVSCLSRVHAGLILKALELGADGVMLLGCDLNNCHFGVDEDRVSKQFDIAQEMMHLLGIDTGRLILVRLQHGDAYGFIKRINEFVQRFAQLPAT